MADSTTIEALPTDGATAMEIAAFIAGTGYVVSRPKPNGKGEFTRQDGEEVAFRQATFGNGFFIVKVDGNLVAPVKDYMLHSTYGIPTTR